jgi:MFS family permease
LLHYADWSATFTFTPLLAKQFGASDQFLGFLTTANLVVVFCGSLGLSIIGNRWKMTRVLIVGFTLISAGLVGLATANSLLFVVISQLFIGFGFGLCYPTLMAASINKVVETERTTAMGLHQSLYASGMFIGPWLSGIIASSFGTSWMFILTTLAVLLIFLVSLSKWRNE